MKKTLTFLFILGLALVLRVPGTNAQTLPLAITLTGDSKITSANVGNIGWYTNVNATCGIDFSKNQDLSNGIGTNAKLVQVGLPTNDGNFYFTVQLNSLTPSTNYYYKITCTTADGQSFTSSLEELPQYSQPATIVISNLGVPTVSITSNSLTVTWLTNINTDSIVYYEASGDTSWSWQGTDTLTNNHSVVLPNLKPNTYYNIYVNAKDANGNVVKSSTTWGQTVAANNTPLTISVNNNSINSSGSTAIYWNTNVNASCGIDLGTKSDLSDGIGTNGNLIQTGLSTNDGKFYFVVNRSNLDLNTDYYYHVICTTADGQDVTSDIQTLHKYSQSVANDTLTVTKTGVGMNSAAGSGIVTDASGVINCGNTCSAQFANGTTVTLTAAPAADSVFGSWTGCGATSMENKNQVCTIQLEGDTHLNASFISQAYEQTTQGLSLTVKNFESGNGQAAFNLVNTGNNAATFYLSIFDNTTNNPIQATLGQTKQYSLTAGQSVHVYLVNTGNASNFASGNNSLTIKELSLDGQTVYNSQNFIFNFSQSSTVTTAPSVTDITNSASQLYSGNTDSLLAQINQLRSTIAEQASQIKYLASLIKGVPQIPQATLDAINNFITYGVDQNTVKLGAGQRAAVVNSFKSAFDRLPTTQTDITDVVKIANGRWPGQTSATAIAAANVQFQKVYLRAADMSNANDNAAITIMAYGLQQQAQNRNLNSEKAGIKTFKAVYGRLPTSAQDWNVVMAITYSGATR